MGEKFHRILEERHGNFDLSRAAGEVRCGSSPPLYDPGPAMNPSYPLIEGLKKRMVPEGGFAFFKGGRYRSDATAWAIIGLRSAGEGESLLESGRDRLAREQLPDGRVVVSPDAPGAFWVTALAVLAWDGSERHSGNMNRAVEFLTKTSGRHWPRQESEPVDHDTSILGWPWTADTHSWVTPTSYSLLAFRAAGKIRHPRAVEAARMVMNRQLATGGWNYGNTSVFGRQLYPQPDQTGVALSALRRSEEHTSELQSLS
jgi:hypothetical protein